MELVNSSMNYDDCINTCTLLQIPKQLAREKKEVLCILLVFMYNNMMSDSTSEKNP